MKFVYVICFISIIRYTNAFTACSGGTIGNDPPSSFAASLDTSGNGYLLEDEIYQVPCCGSITSWQLQTNAAGTVVLQVWRKTGPNSYTLVGRNSVSAGSGSHTETVAQADRISVQHGDYIGCYRIRLGRRLSSLGDIIVIENAAFHDRDSLAFRYAATNIIKHSTLSGYPVTNWYSSTITDLATGSIYDWTTEDIVGSEMKFAIKAIVSASTVPSFTFGTTTTVSITDTTAADDNILTLSVTDDGGDTIVYSTYANDNSYFYVDTNNGQVKTRQTNIPEGTYTITPMVTDNCYNTATTVVTVTVTNVALTFDGFSESSATISEDDYLEKNLTDVLVTEPNDNYYCYFTSSAAFPFITRQANVLYPGYAVYLQDWPQLDYDTKTSYTLRVECIEAISASPVSADGTFTVTITRNSGPSMSTATDSVTLNATTDWTGKFVYTVGITDPENDPLTMTISTSPAGGPFTITDAGHVILTSNIKAHTTVSSYSLTIIATDSDVNSQVQMTLTVTITDINNAPSINNLPTSQSVTENEDLGKSVFQVSVTEADAEDTLEFYAQFDPSYGSKLFTLNSTTGVVSTSESTLIDYDVIGDHSIEMYVTASDGKYFDTETLTLTITNVNEEPVMSQSYFKIARDEGASGALFPTIVYDVDDPDVASASDTLTYTKSCGADDSRVSMHSSTGQFSFSVNYDLDDASYPTDFSCTVTVTDAAGLTDTCIVDVHVDYVNEDTPTFTAASYSVTVLYTELIGTIVVTAPATDSDLGDQGKFYYELTNTQNLFGVFQNGSVFLNADLGPYYPNGHTVAMTMKAEDTGGLFTTVTITITIPATTVVDTVYTTETPWTFFENQMNMMVYEVACAVILACLFLALYLAIYYIRKANVTQLPYRPLQVKPVTLPNVLDKNGGILPANQKDQTMGNTSTRMSQNEQHEEPKIQVRPLFGSQKPVDTNTLSPPPPYFSPQP